MPGAVVFINGTSTIALNDRVHSTQPSALFFGHCRTFCFVDDDPGRRSTVSIIADHCCIAESPPVGKIGREAKQCYCKLYITTHESRFVPGSFFQPHARESTGSSTLGVSRSTCRTTGVRGPLVEPKNRQPPRVSWYFQRQQQP